jgi:membrane-associated phospholipid phosphatase
MFQTDLILYLQSLASDGLTAFMNAVTTLGDDKLLAVILLLIPLGVSFRRGILLLQVFMWTLLATDGIKAVFNLPRPTFVHANVQNLQHNSANVSPFTSAGSETFFGSMDPQVMAAFRLRGDGDFGFPSGHVSSTVALWGGMALLFRKRILTWVALILIILVALSRMYLGRHFLGDVLGGIAVGVAILAIAYLLLDRWGFAHNLFERASLEFAPRLPNVLFYTLLLVGPLFLGILSPDVLGKGAGYLVGANAALILLMMRGLSDDAGPWLKRIARVSLGLLLYFGAYGIAELILEPTGLESIAFIDIFVRSAVLVSVSVYGAHSVSDWLAARV